MQHLLVVLFGSLAAAAVLGVATHAGSPAARAAVHVVRRMPGLNHLSTVVRFDHATGTASRAVVDEGSGRVIRAETLPGRPQSSRAEFDEAVSIIGRHAELARLLGVGAEPEGGFIVDGPREAPPAHRYIQIRLLTPDRRHLLRVVVVDLTAGGVASSRSWFE